MFDETLNIGERLMGAVKLSAVENYRDRRMVVNGDKKAMNIIHKTGVGNKLRLNEVGWKKSEGFTRVGLVPLSSSLILGEITTELDRRDFAVCIACYGEKIDGMRHGAFRSLVIMSQQDAEWFVGEIKKRPTLVYGLVRYINGGAIQQFDKSPADIRPGKAVEILANTSVGGTMTQKGESVPFPANFIPNPPF